MATTIRYSGCHSRLLVPKSVVADFISSEVAVWICSISNCRWWRIRDRLDLFNNTHGRRPYEALRQSDRRSMDAIRRHVQEHTSVPHG
jgi:hypothetical protein